MAKFLFYILFSTLGIFSILKTTDINVKEFIKFKTKRLLENFTRIIKLTPLKLIYFHLSQKPITENSVKIEQLIFWFNWKSIAIKYDKFKFQKDSHIYLYNSSQRVAIVFTEDLESDFLTVTEDYQDSIIISSNKEAKNIFDEIEKRITKQTVC